MHRVLLLGAGKIGRMIAHLLTDSGDYRVCVADHDEAALSRARSARDIQVQLLDATNADALSDAMRQHDTVISALSYQFNVRVAECALHAGINYYDLTEDVQTTRAVVQLAARAGASQVFMPQCGLAPGFISIVAAYLARHFDHLDAVRMRVGALPQFPTDALQYNLTWSTDGLINEYCNGCDAIHDGERIELLPLEGLEEFLLDGDRYEAFNTSGGLGTLCDTLAGQVRELNYKTVRYVGHRDLVRFLIYDLRLNERRDLLKNILERAVPITYQDVVVTFCTVTGQRHGELVQLSDSRKIYCQSLDGEIWSAIQITTAAAVCCVLDLSVSGKLPAVGFVRQEQVDFRDFIRNRFGQYFASGVIAAGDDALTLMEIPE